MRCSAPITSAVLSGILLVGGCASPRGGGAPPPPPAHTATESAAISDDVSWAPPPPPSVPEQYPAGPTLMSRVDGGFELRNRRVRAVIDERTGNLVYWGNDEARRNLL